MDYQLSKISVADKKTYTVCGVPDYMSPEQISQAGHTDSVDLWAIGVLVHELLFGKSPFTADNEMETYSKIANVSDSSPVAVPNRNIASDAAARTLIQSLLQSNPSKRLGAAGMLDIKNHPYFAKIRWQGLHQEPSPLLSIMTAEKDKLHWSAAAQSKVQDLWSVAYVGSGWDHEVDTATPF